MARMCGQSAVGMMVQFGTIASIRPAQASRKSGALGFLKFFNHPIGHNSLEFNFHSVADAGIEN